MLRILGLVAALCCTASFAQEVPEGYVEKNYDGVRYFCAGVGGIESCVWAGSTCCSRLKPMATDNFGRSFRCSAKIECQAYTESKLNAEKRLCNTAICKPPFSRSP